MERCTFETFKAWAESQKPTPVKKREPCAVKLSNPHELRTLPTRAQTYGISEWKWELP